MTHINFTAKKIDTTVQCRCIIDQEIQIQTKYRNCYKRNLLFIKYSNNNNVEAELESQRYCPPYLSNADLQSDT